MKIIALGDTHGRNYWKSVADTHSFDQLVFIGDYFDSFDITATEQISNFLDIVAYKRANPDSVILLFGNHDFHYLPVAREANETFSGFQDRLAFQIGHLIQENLDIMQMCYKWKNYLFTHAGVTHSWLNNAGYKEGEVDVFINDLFKYKPAQFFFNGWDPYGDNVTQSPVWVRPRSLKKNAFNYETIKQVVGHTRVEKLEIVKERYFFIDTMDSSREYLIIEDGKVSVGKISKP